MRTTYRGHTIETETAPHDGGGWGVKISVFRKDGTPVAERLDRRALGGAVIFPTAQEADQAGVLLARAWINSYEAGSTEPS